MAFTGHNTGFDAVFFCSNLCNSSFLIIYSIFHNDGAKTEFCFSCGTSTGRLGASSMNVFICVKSSSYLRSRTSRSCGGWYLHPTSGGGWFLELKIKALHSVPQCGRMTLSDFHLYYLAVCSGAIWSWQIEVVNSPAWKQTEPAAANMGCAAGQRTPLHEDQHQSPLY